VYDVEKRAPMSADTVLSHWGYKPNVGPGLRALSALRQYGLIEDQGGQYRISEDAFHILNLSETSPERAGAIGDAAMRPTLIRHLVEHFPEGLPSDVNLRDYLIRLHRFNPDSVATFIKVLRETVEFAKLYEGRHNRPDLMEMPLMPQNDTQREQSAKVSDVTKVVLGMHNVFQIRLKDGIIVRLDASGDVNSGHAQAIKGLVDLALGVELKP